jgi:hypothetical protein
MDTVQHSSTQYVKGAAKSDESNVAAVGPLGVRRVGSPVPVTRVIFEIGANRG